MALSIFVAGIGAVSPGGWSVAETALAVRTNALIEPHNVAPAHWEKPLLLKAVPPLPSRPKFASHARLRRASPLSMYAASAALEALGGKPCPRLGLLTCMQSGPVQYACRFYEELLKDPAMASPLLFPETVFSAPGSHVAALLGETPCASTLLGDPSAFLQAMAMACAWLDDGKVDFCLVLGGEESNLIHAKGGWYLDPSTVIGPGAGAVLLTCKPEHSAGVELEAITDPHVYSPATSVLRAAISMRAQLPSFREQEVLVDSRGGARRLDRAEAEAWRDWTGASISPKAVLGEGLMAGSAWQVVMAIHALIQQEFEAANVSVVGLHQHAIGARFVQEKRRVL